MKKFWIVFGLLTGCTTYVPYPVHHHGHHQHHPHGHHQHRGHRH
ncbi:MAG: hypothetical protein ACXW2E_01880 [Nitrososphaeraceae archaeon]